MNIKSIAKVGAKSAFRWFSIFIPGLIISTIFVFIALYLLYNGDSIVNGSDLLSGSGRIAAHGGAGGGKFAAIILAVQEFIRLSIMDPYPMLLAITSSSVMLYVYFAVASKYSLSAAFSDIWNSNLSSWFSDKLTSYINKLSVKSKTVSKVDNKATEKLRLMQSIKNDKSTSKWQKRLLRFVLKKIKLNDTTFSDSETKFSEVLQEKIKIAAEELARPSKKLIYLAYGVHILIFILAIVFDNK